MSLKIAFLDVESTGLDAESSFIVGYGMMLEDGGWIHRFIRSVREEPSLLEAAIKEVSGFDMVVTWNGKGFDFPLLIARALKHRLDPSPVLKMRHVDLYELSRSFLRLSRYGLDDVCRFLGVEKKVLLKGSDMPPLYLRAIEGDGEAMKIIEEHCYDDLQALKKVFERMRGLVEVFLAAKE